MGAGGLTVQLALCSGPLALQVCSTAVTHPPWMHTPESLLLPLCSPTSSLGATSPTGCWSQPAVPAGSPHPRQSARGQAQASPYPWRVLFHLVLVAVGTAGMASPEAVLTELVIVALLAAVAEPHHALAVAVGTLNGMEDCGRETPSFNPKQRNQRKSRCKKSLNGRVNLFFFPRNLWHQVLSVLWPIELYVQKFMCPSMNLAWAVSPKPLTFAGQVPVSLLASARNTFKLYLREHRGNTQVR